MELDYVHRSSQSDLSPVVDVIWTGPTSMIVGFSNGLIEIIDVEERRLITSFHLDKALLGICAAGQNKILIQAKYGSVSLHQFDVWKCLWTVSTKSASSFSRPAVYKDALACVVSEGQSVLSLINIETGYVEKAFNVHDALPGAKGMVVAIQSGNESDPFWILTESGHLISLSTTGSVLRSIQIAFPHVESVPTSLWVDRVDVFGIVGFSTGQIDRTFPNRERLFEIDGGVGSLCVCRQTHIIAGSWKGSLYTSGSKLEDQPHFASIGKVAVDPLETRIAAGSSDGRVSLYFIDPVVF